MKPFQLNFLHIAILASFVFLGIVVSPFLTTLLLAAILVTGTYPIYNWILKKVRGHKVVASIIMSLSIGVLFSIVFILFILLLSQEAVSTYQGFDSWLRESKFNLNSFIGKLVKLSAKMGVPQIDIIPYITQSAQTFSTLLVQQSTLLLKSIVWLIINFFLLVFTMFFFYKDGKYLIARAEKMTPLPMPYGQQIFSQFRQVCLGMLYGIFFTAIVQGILGGIGLWIAGVGNPIFWGTIMGFFGMLPVGGTGIIWLPAGIYLLFISGHYLAGIFLLIWGGLIVAFVDNLIKPFLISKQTKIYPLATFIVVIGGLMVFGLKGAIIAPMVLAALLSFLNIYTAEEKPSDFTEASTKTS